MRIRLGALLVCAVVGCSASPEVPTPSCHHESRDCSSDGVRSRVLKSFSSAKLQEVLACVDAPARFCGGANADEEACLVSASSDGIAEYRTNDPDGSSTPLLVLKLFRGFGVHQAPVRTFHRRFPGPHGEPRHESIFTTAASSLAVLYVSEVRCTDITEITGSALTNRWSGRVMDKVPTSYTGARAAQLNR